MEFQFVGTYCVFIHITHLLQGEKDDSEKADHTKLELGDSAKIKLPMWAQGVQVLKESDTCTYVSNSVQAYIRKARK